MYGRNALTALGLGQVSILEDAAVAVPAPTDAPPLPPPDPGAHPESLAHPDNPYRRHFEGMHGRHHRVRGGNPMWHGQGVTNYHEPDYKHSDDCHLGCANLQPFGTTIPAEQSFTVQGVPTSPFKPVSVIIPSYLQVGLFIAQVTIGPFNAVEGDPVPAAGHSEVSLNQFVSWPTIQANSPIKFMLNNGNATDIDGLSIDVRGIRLRE
jgi:hypothetical protein